jgi:hypothetical protein
VFVGGCGRSGTTLLGSMLGTHPSCLATPESRFRFLPYRRRPRTGEPGDLGAALERALRHWSFRIWGIDPDRDALLDGCASWAELVLRVVRAYARANGRAGARLWIDHTPGNVKFASLLFEQFPEAKLIHVVRDGRAAAASVLPLDWGPSTPLAAAKWWVRYVRLGLACERRHGPRRVRRVAYERLVAEPETELRGLCDFLEIDYDPRMVEGTGFAVPEFTASQHALVGRRPDPARREAWRDVLSPRDTELFESLAAGLLAELGYRPVHGARARPPTARERAGGAARELYRRHISNRMRLRRRIHRSVSDA